MSRREALLNQNSVPSENKEKAISRSTRERARRREGRQGQRAAANDNNAATAAGNYACLFAISGGQRNASGQWHRPPRALGRQKGEHVRQPGELGALAVDGVRMVRLLLEKMVRRFLLVHDAENELVIGTA